MITLRVRNVNHALHAGMSLLSAQGVREDSRNGPVLRAPEPVCTVYEHPEERVMFSLARDANPFFHLYESIWMLAGRDDVEPVAKFVNRMRDYSDDNLTFRAAYGRRWRRHPYRATPWSDQAVFDQLGRIVENLRTDHNCRRQVLQIWRVDKDMLEQGLDVACNLICVFRRRAGSDRTLDMTVTCRSNDMIWGAYGANAVHFSMLHEYVAAFSGMVMGRMYQVSVDLHAYVDKFEVLADRMSDSVRDEYKDASVRHKPIAHGAHLRDRWDTEAARFITPRGNAPFMGHDHERFTLPFFLDVALPVVRAHDQHKAGETGRALKTIRECVAEDWRLACTEWLERRL